MINRSAVILKYKEPFVRWINGADPSFFNRPFIIVKDVHHSQEEERFYALGKTDQDRRLFIAFTIRKKLIRVISSRDMSKKERKVYEKG